MLRKCLKYFSVSLFLMCVPQITNAGGASITGDEFQAGLGLEGAEPSPFFTGIAGSTPDDFDNDIAEFPGDSILEVDWVDDDTFSVTLVIAESSDIVVRLTGLDFMDGATPVDITGVTFNDAMTSQEEFFDYENIVGPDVSFTANTIDVTFAFFPQLPAADGITWFFDVMAGDISEPMPVGLSIMDLEVNEDDGTAMVSVMLNPANTQAVTVRFASKPGTAIPGEDFRGRSGKLNFAPGDTMKTIMIPLLDNNIEEDIEEFIVRLFTSTNAPIADNVATVTINDDDAPPEPTTISVMDLEVDEDVGTAMVQVKLNQMSSDTVTVKFATKPGTALPGEDFRGKSGKLTFNPGETMKTISVKVIDDASSYEPAESFIVRLFTATNATIADDVATVTINDLDAPP